MEKWAKKLNAQKEAQKADVRRLMEQAPTTVAAPSQAAPQQTSCAADAGFSLLEKVRFNRLVSI